jgi:hypothetical protein
MGELLVKLWQNRFLLEFEVASGKPMTDLELNSALEEIEQHQKKCAAAAATAVALAIRAEQNTIKEYPLPLNVTMSTRQAMLRSKFQHGRGNVR